MVCLRASLFVLATASVAACTTPSGSDGEAGETGELGEGEAVYRQTVADGNSFTCSTCHALSEPSADGLRRPGHPIADATRRPTWKNGQLTDMREAVNSCLSEWMNAEPWSADDPRWLALHDFLDEQAELAGIETAEALSFSIVEPPEDLTGGDPDDGRALFNGSCAVCHGEDGLGTNQAPPVTGFGHAPQYTARRVRTSGRLDSPVYDGLTGGVMPFWSAERLTNAELLDLVAYLEILDESDTSTEDGGEEDTGTTTGSDCDATSERVGWTAELENFFHDVGGTAEIVDDCTVVISNFTYDGTGIDVRIYGGQNGDYDNGFAMTDDLLQPGGYDGTTLVATLPDGESIDDLDGVSVWCVDVGVDFGSGVFAPP